MNFFDPRLNCCPGKKCRHRTVAEVAPPVNEDKLPSWLSRLAFKHCDVPRSIPGGFGRLVHAARQCGGSEWVDHWGSATVGKHKNCFVSEPYDLRGESVAALVEFCRRCGIRFDISAVSNHFPTRTLRIVLYPPEVR